MTVQERQALVREFHRMNDEPVNDAPELPSPEQAALRAKFIMEEALELINALGIDVHLPVCDEPGPFDGDVIIDRLEFLHTRDPDFVAAVDGLRDLEYQLHGAELVLGVCEATDATFLEVHRSNMEKQHVHYGDKALKPAGWKPPRIAEALRKTYPKKALLFRK
jgi:predicted HAD superfamily Cof-like phosphohydrolase